MAEERLQKILAQAGYGSRRSTEEIITAGRVTVNGKVAILGQKADASSDTIQVDGRVLPKSENSKVYIALHKPKAVLSDKDPNHPRPTVFDLVPQHDHLFAVGRLDMDSEGLMLLTNDGDLANRLTHPRYGHEKEYYVVVGRQPDAEQLSALQHGVVLEDGRRTAPAKVFSQGPAGKNFSLRFVLREGRKRQIREMCKRIGLPVQRILRVRIGTLELGDLKPGQWRNLTGAEVAALSATSSEPKPRSRPNYTRRPSNRPNRPNRPTARGSDRKKNARD